MDLKEQMEAARAALKERRAELRKVREAADAVFQAYIKPAEDALSKARADGEGPRYLAPADEAWEREAKPEPAKPTVAELINQIKTSLAPCVVNVRVEAGGIEAAPTGPTMAKEAA